MFSSSHSAEFEVTVVIVSEGADVITENFPVTLFRDVSLHRILAQVRNPRFNMKDESTDDQAAIFHFNSLAHDNESTSTVLETDALVDLADDRFVKTFHPRTHTARIQSVVWGTQTVSKYHEHASHDNVVRIYVACIRILSVTIGSFVTLIIAHAYKHCHLVQCV